MVNLGAAYPSMRFFSGLILLSVSIVVPHPVRAQSLLPISVGAYGELGDGTVGATADSSFNNGIFTLGVYAELPRVLLRPGLDLRCVCGDNAVQGMLTGPRVSADLGPFRPYAEAFFGPNHASYSASPTVSPVDQNGITSEGVVGLDWGRGGFFHWRVVEVSFGSFSGIAGSKPVSVSTGVVFRIPRAHLP
jgi:hypothetical protein